MKTWKAPRQLSNKLWFNNKYEKRQSLWYKLKKSVFVICMICSHYLFFLYKVTSNSIGNCCHSKSSDVNKTSRFMSIWYTFWILEHIWHAMASLLLQNWKKNKTTKMRKGSCIVFLTECIIPFYWRTNKGTNGIMIGCWKKILT